MKEKYVSNSAIMAKLWIIFSRNFLVKNGVKGMCPKMLRKWESEYNDYISTLGDEEYMEFLDEIYQISYNTNSYDADDDLIEKINNRMEQEDETKHK